MVHPFRNKFALLSFLLVSFVSSFVFGGGWMDHVTNLNATASKITMKEEELTKLIVEKRHSKSEEAVREIMTQMVAAHKMLVELNAELRELKNHVRYYHPEQGDMVERKYMTTPDKSLAEFESEVGIDGKLNRMKNQLKEIYSEQPKPTPVMKQPKPEKVEKEEEYAKPRPNMSIIKPKPTPERPILSK